MGVMNNSSFKRFWGNVQPKLVRDCTREEYEILSDEQKAGLWIISDEDSLVYNGKPLLISSDSDGDNSNTENFSEKYSEEEIVIGTWIDGKPIYKRTWIGATASKANTWTFTGIAIDNLDYLVDFSAIAKSSSTDAFVRLPYFETASTYANLVYWPSMGGFVTYCYHSGGAFYSMPFTLTAKYTKTTD